MLERVFDAKKSKVWQALTQKELMKKWYFNLTEFRPEVGFKFEFWGSTENGVKYKHLCEIVDLVFESRLSYTWQYEGYRGVSTVTFELTDEAGKTRLKLTHEGIGNFPAEVPDFAIHNFQTGWNHIIHISLNNFLHNSIQ